MESIKLTTLYISDSANQFFGEKESLIKIKDIQRNSQESSIWSQDFIESQISNDESAIDESSWSTKKKIKKKIHWSIQFDFFTNKSTWNADKKSAHAISEKVFIMNFWNSSRVRRWIAWGLVYPCILYIYTFKRLTQKKLNVLHTSACRFFFSLSCHMEIDHECTLFSFLFSVKAWNQWKRRKKHKRWHQADFCIHMRHITRHKSTELALIWSSLIQHINFAYK